MLCTTYLFKCARSSYLVAQPQAVIVATGGTGEGWCNVHNVPMKLNSKDGHSWYSHQAPEGGSCKGRSKGQGRSVPATHHTGRREDNPRQGAPYAVCRMVPR